MENSEISEDVLEFLTRRIDSVPHLEALLLFWENPAVAWTATEIGARVYVSRDKARAILQDLMRHGFIAPAPGAAPDTGYCYQPGWDQAQIMTRTAEVYRRHLVPIAELIHAKAESSSVHAFARAFKFKKEE
jgi:hypothetical protein